MTMSLARGLTTLNTKKRKPKKFTLKQQERNEVDRRAYNKRMKRLGLHNQQMSSEEYEQYLLGNYKTKSKKTYIGKKPDKATFNKYEKVYLLKENDVELELENDEDPEGNIETLAEQDGNQEDEWLSCDKCKKKNELYSWFKTT